jgi:hypothetical protein
VKYMTPHQLRNLRAEQRRTPPAELQRIHDAETYQSYFPDHAADERHPQPGIDAVHRHFGEYLDQHPEGT